ncbi:hypothetical protein IWX92DRAFT_46869 [Phyllosticta citricarpa]
MPSQKSTPLVTLLLFPSHQHDILPSKEWADDEPTGGVVGCIAYVIGQFLFFGSSMDASTPSNRFAPLSFLIPVFFFFSLFHALPSNFSGGRRHHAFALPTPRHALDPAYRLSCAALSVGVTA